MDKKEKNKYGLDVAAEKLNLPKYDVREDLSVGVEPLYDDQMEDLQGRIKQPVQTMRGAELPEVEVTASAPRQEKLKKVVPIADVVDEVKPLPYERVNEMQRRATNAVRTA